MGAVLIYKYPAIREREGEREMRFGSVSESLYVRKVVGRKESKTGMKEDYIENWGGLILE